MAKKKKTAPLICRICSNLATSYGLCNLCKTLATTTARTYTSPTFVCLSAYCEKCNKTKMKTDFKVNLDGTTKKWCIACVELHCQPKQMKSKPSIKKAVGDNYSERNHNLLLLGYHSYSDYLCSDRWAKIRDKVFKQKGHWCAICRRKAEEMHHNRYAFEDLEGSNIKHIFPICSNCHYRIEHRNGEKVDLITARSQFHRLKSECKKARLAVQS